MPRDSRAAAANNGEVRGSRSFCCCCCCCYCCCCCCIPSTLSQPATLDCRGRSHMPNHLHCARSIRKRLSKNSTLTFSPLFPALVQAVAAGTGAENTAEQA
ncbi:hypothetical protein GQ42DRAFT_82530 [Ramicandelaber brevisporus]|nr:hypothetical protein GQ42DRAFT_82530 [Ramicandelaber brevisporus]